jgi:glutaminyl-peptide cyclotransferase
MGHLKALTTVAAHIFSAIIFTCSMADAQDTDLTFNYRVLHIYGHDSNSQVEGLEYVDGFIYEGTGPCLNAPSGLRKIDMTTGNIVMIRELPLNYFGEGITLFKDKIAQLTYRTRIGFVYEKKTFDLIKEFYYPTEGWGMTNDGQNLIMSDGSDTLRWLDPEDFHEVKRLAVKDDKGPVYKLNELEYIDGVIFANVFETSRIVCISLETGRVIGSIDLAALLKNQFPIKDPLYLANGIAHDASRNRLFITGKYWSKIYELELVNKDHRHHKREVHPGNPGPDNLSPATLEGAARK